VEDVLIARHDDTSKLQKQWKTNDLPLAARTMKHVAGMNVVSESSADMYTATPSLKASHNGDSKTE
jgi:predicted transcriptional regulator